MTDPVTAYLGKQAAGVAVRGARRYLAPVAAVVLGLLGMLGLFVLDVLNPGDGATAVAYAAGTQPCTPDVLDPLFPTSEPPTTGPPTSGPAELPSVVAANAARAQGFVQEDLVIAVAVAGAESGWDPDVIGGPNGNGSYDYGLWQINSVHSDLLAGGDWRDPGYNAFMAYSIWADAGDSWTPWVTYNSGAYLDYMDLAAAAVAGSGGGGCLHNPGAGPIAGDLYERTMIIADAINSGEPEPFYGNTDYYRMCARLSANIHSYASSGYFSAITQWNHYVMQGMAHRDSNPPPGALLFYNTSPYGHVATNLGADDSGVDQVATNDIYDSREGLHGGVYVVPFDELINGAWHLPYLGWADPVYPGQPS